MDDEERVRKQRRVMISVNRLLQILAGLFAIDIVLTFIAVGYMGAIELNPVMTVFGFAWSMILKLLISIVALGIFYKYAPRSLRVARPAILSLVGLYGGVAVSNVYQLSKVVV
jgi:hypothetical protein